MSAYFFSTPFFFLLLGSHYYPDHSVPFLFCFFFGKKNSRETRPFFFTWSSFRYDEGTVFIPVVTHKRLLPVSDEFRFMALDEDGYDLPADW